MSTFSELIWQFTFCRQRIISHLFCSIVVDGSKVQKHNQLKSETQSKYWLTLLIWAILCPYDYITIKILIYYLLIFRLLPCSFPNWYGIGIVIFIYKAYYFKMGWPIFSIFINCWIVASMKHNRYCISWNCASVSDYTLKNKRNVTNQ